MLHTYSHTHTQTYSHTCAHTNILSHRHTYKHSHTQTYVHAHTQTYMHTHTQTYVHTQTYLRARAHTNLVHAHTQTYLQEELYHGCITVLTGEMKSRVITIVLLVDVGVGGALSDKHLDDVQVPLPGGQVERGAAGVVRNLGGRSTLQQQVNSVTETGGMAAN